jgi:type I restriction enzyme S subunit
VIVRPKEQKASNEFLYCLLSREEFREHAYSYANGTTVLHLSKKALPEYKCVLPLPNIIDNFTKLVHSLYAVFDNNELQNNTLASIRDTLLPKLLSGEIRVKDAEKFVEAKL